MFTAFEERHRERQHFEERREAPDLERRFSLHRQEGSLIILDSWSPEPETHLVRRFGSDWFQKQRLSKLVPHEALRTVPIARSSRGLVISQRGRGQCLICGPAVTSLMPAGATFPARSGTHAKAR